MTPTEPTSPEPFGDIPLFRELQRLLSSGGGPVNFEIAKQVAGAVASRGGYETSVDRQVERSLADDVRELELVMSGYTRLSLDEPLRTEVLTVPDWVSATLDAWKWLFERTAARFSDEMAKMGGEVEGAVNPMQTALGQITPLLMGIQVGNLVGHLATEALARYDLPIPRDDEGLLFLVAPNVNKVALDYGFEPAQLQRWLATRDVARHLTLSHAPWIQKYFKAVLGEVVDATEIDIEDLERRLMELQSLGMEGLQDAEGLDDSIPVVPTERHRRALARLHAFVALVEGYANHAAQAVGRSRGVDMKKVDEAMTRHRAAPSQGTSMLSNMLGIDMDRALEAAGRTFCAAIVELKGLTTLNRVWAAADNLPSLGEIKDPFLWIERVATSEELNPPEE